MRFYDEFKFAVESVGLPAPPENLFTNAGVALGTLTVCLQTYSQLPPDTRIETLLDYIKYAGYNFWATVVRGAKVAPPITAAAMTYYGQVGFTGLKVGAYVGACAAAAYLGVLVGAAAYAAGHADGNPVEQTAAGFWHWWYGGSAKDAETAEMLKLLELKRQLEYAAKRS